MSGSDASQRPVAAPDRDAVVATLPTDEAFVDRVMSSIGVVPSPTPTRTFLAAIRAASVRDAFAALWVAWHLGTVRRWPVAPRVRARSFALVLAVASILATGSLAAAAAVRVVAPQVEGAPLTAPGGPGLDMGQPAMEDQPDTDLPGRIEEDRDVSNPLDASEDADDDAGSTSAGDQVDESDDHGTSEGDDPDDADDSPDADEDDGSDGGGQSEDAHGSGDESDTPDDANSSSDGDPSDDHSSDGGASGGHSGGGDESDDPDDD
jgi:hypothetical protein